MSVLAADSSLNRQDVAGSFGGRARYFNAYRLASYVLFLYALGHTFGAVVATPKLGPESDAAVSAMKTVHVPAQGADCTYFFSAPRAFSAALAMLLGFACIRDARARDVGPIA